MRQDWTGFSAERASVRSVTASTIFYAVAIWGAVVLLLVLVLPHRILPAEDALILFQFSRNLAHTGEITFVSHGAHAEGATDFLWMALLAGGLRLHVAPFLMTSFLNVAALVALPFVLASIAGTRLRLSTAMFAIGAVGCMPQITAAVLGFSVLPFCLLLALMVLLFLRRNDAGLAVASLLLCLFRPDGVVFAVPLLVASMMLFEGRGRRARVFVAGFVVPGALYFFWRWHYFQSMLPLPFLVKANAQRIAHLFVLGSVQQALLLCVFSGLMSYQVLRPLGRVDRVTGALVFCVLVVPSVFYCAMRLDQDVGHRFFGYLPVGLAILIARMWPTVVPRRDSLLVAGAGLFLLLVSTMWWTAVQDARAMQFDNRKAIAEELAKLPHGTLLVTEAGLLPYYSEWPAVDAWGLNTAAFSRELIRPTDVAMLRPDVILMHTTNGLECTEGSGWKTPYATRTWSNMTRNVVEGAGAAYELWIAPFGSLAWRAQEHLHPWQAGQECWLVRRESPLRGGVVAVLERHNALPYPEYLAKAGRGKGTEAKSAGASPGRQPSAARRLAWRLVDAWGTLNQST